MVRACDLRQKEVINIRTAERMGYINDVEINFETGNIDAIVIPRRKNIFNMISGKKDYVVEWNHIVKIGRELVLVEYREEDEALSVL